MTEGLEPVAPSQDTSQEVMMRAVADLWSQVIEVDDDHIVFYDHYGNPARLRRTENRYFIAWVTEESGEPAWDESDRAFESPREAALHAFQGPTLGR